MDTIGYFDRNGRRCSEAEAKSYVHKRPWNFDFYIRKPRLLFRWLGPKWVFHHHVTTFGSWMWPEGLPMKFDDDGKVIDQRPACEAHAKQIGSTWEFEP